MLSLLFDILPALFKSLIMVVPLVVSLYVLCTPRHKLTADWQTYRLRRTHRALKDRDFRNLPRRIWLLKGLSVVVFALSLAALVLTAMDLIERQGKLPDPNAGYTEQPP